MKALTVLVLIFGNIALLNASDSVEQPPDVDSGNDVDDEMAKVGENRMAAQLYAVLEHFKQPDPIGLPGVPIPEPIDVPDIRKSLSVANLHMTKVKAYGLSKFRILTVNTDLKGLKVEASIQLDEMVMNGTYSLSSLFSSSKGPFTIVLKNVIVSGLATLVVEREGNLKTDQIKMDITFADMVMDFQNMGFLGSIFQNLINTAPTLVFDSMKPFMLQEADKQLRSEINTNVVKLMGDRRLPNSISPLDMAIAEGRKKVRAMGYDPYRIPNYNRTMGSFTVGLENTWISGISNFYRIGNVAISMEKNALQLLMHVGTQQITGAGQWEIGFGLLKRYGQAQFTVQHIRMLVSVIQPLDTRKHPQINDLQIELGNIQVRCEGAGTLDYVMEFFVNILPNLLRYQIMDALENPIKQRIQAKFNTIDVEKAIKDAIENFNNGNQTVPLNFDF